MSHPENIYHKHKCPEDRYFQEWICHQCGRTIELKEIHKDHFDTLQREDSRKEKKYWCYRHYLSGQTAMSVKFGGYKDLPGNVSMEQTYGCRIHVLFNRDITCDTCKKQKL